jgi:hypothetical protein
LPRKASRDDDEEEVEEGFSKEDAAVWSNESDDDVSKSYIALMMT